MRIYIGYMLAALSLGFGQSAQGGVTATASITCQTSQVNFFMSMYSFELPPGDAQRYMEQNWFLIRRIAPPGSGTEDHRNGQGASSGLTTGHMDFDFMTRVTGRLYREDGAHIFTSWNPNCAPEYRFTAVDKVC